MSVTAPLSHRELAQRYDGRVPRYTSYPTAVQFTGQVTADVHRQWLGAVGDGADVSLYVHVPFCARLCWFCGCNTRAVNRPEPIADYVEHLQIEIARIKDALGGRPRARQLHLGGGTPNMLAPADLERLVAALHGVFDFRPGAEMAAELDPVSLTHDWVRAATRLGLNRASLGVQDLTPRVQAAVNRNENFETVARAVAWLREAQVRSINIDLMYGLPHQHVGDVLATIDKVLTLRPERLSLFGYAHVPWAKAHQRLIDETALPGAVERLDQAEAAAEHLVAAGYVRIGLDHFALPDDELAAAQASGRLHRNFQGYTTDAAPVLIGLGASAISQFPQGYAQNEAQEIAWRARLTHGGLPTARGVALTDEDRFRGEIIERLMCDLEVDLGEICARHDRNVGALSSERAALRRLAEDGLVESGYAYAKVTAAGRPLVRSICAVFDRHLDAAPVRHARGV